VAEHAAGNYRVMMDIADELLVAAVGCHVPQLDEKLHFSIRPTAGCGPARPVMWEGPAGRPAAPPPIRPAHETGGT
jgi:hypothetical protein